MKTTKRRNVNTPTRNAETWKRGNVETPRRLHVKAPTRGAQNRERGNAGLLPGAGRWLAVGALLLVATAGGCGGREPDGGNENGRSAGVTKVARDAGVKLSLSVDHERPREDDRVVVTVEGEAEPGVTLTLGDYGPGLRANPFEFAARPLPEVPPTIAADGKVVRRRQFELEFFLPGEYELPGATATVLDERDRRAERQDSAATPDAPANDATGGPGQPPATAVEPDVAVKAERELKTEPIKLIVSAIGDAQPTPEELATLPMPAPMELAEEPAAVRRRNWLLAGAVAAAVVALAAAWRWWRRRPVEAVEVVVPPYEWAMARLAELLADDPLGRGRAQEFYYRLSAIVRGYIERRFDVAAGEMTTQEFLVAMSRDRRFGEHHRNRLEVFLLSCDMVKYALYRPSSAESDEALAAAREYIEQTRPVPDAPAEARVTEPAAA